MTNACHEWVCDERNSGYSATLFESQTAYSPSSSTCRCGVSSEAAALRGSTTLELK